MYYKVREYYYQSENDSVSNDFLWIDLCFKSNNILLSKDFAEEYFISKRTVTKKESFLTGPLLNCKNGKLAPSSDDYYELILSISEDDEIPYKIKKDLIGNEVSINSSNYGTPLENSEDEAKLLKFATGKHIEIPVWEIREAQLFKKYGR